MLKITFLGTGTSQGVPVIGCKCSVCNSQNKNDQRLRTSILVEADSASLVVDCGPDFRQQMLRAGQERLDAVLFTHAHKDHTAGLDDLRPFIFSQGKPMPLIGEDSVLHQIQKDYGYAFAKKPYPGAPSFELQSISEEEGFTIGGLEVQALRAFHGKLPVLGFLFPKCAYLTDVNRIPEPTLNKIRGVEILILDALRIEAHHSHFTLDEAVSFAEEVQAKQVYLIHISHLMGLHDEVEKTLPNHIQLSYDGLKISV